MKCERIGALLPWYPHGLTAEESAQVAEHLRGCLACQEEFAHIQALRGLVGRALASGPALRPEVWERVAVRTGGLRLGRLRLGSRMLGFSLSLAVRGKTLPILIEFFLFGRKVPIFEYAGGEP